MNPKAMLQKIVKVDRMKKRLEDQLKNRREMIFSEMPRNFGVETLDDLIILLVPYASKSLQRQLRSIRTSKYYGRFDAGVKKRVLDEMRTGEKSTAQISQECGVSISTLRRWKRNWGLTRMRAQSII